MNIDNLDLIVLQRIQFAANMSFHILFPTISIALAWVLLFFKLRFNYTHHLKWMQAYSFWVKIFALTFALGVVSGITMSFQFGTNWPGFMRTVGNIAGPLLAYEVLTAFFLEATFLGIMLFGMKRVSNRMHTLSILLVAIGTSLSAFWILSLNSWMHTPTGFEMRLAPNGQMTAYAVDWLKIIFNPSFPYRLAHMMTASFVTVAFLVAGISAYQWLKKNHSPMVMSTLKTGIFMGAIFVPLQIALGDLHGLNTLHYQPAKLAAMEGIWKTEKSAPAVLFALPDESSHSNHYALNVPALASLYLTHSLDGEVKGLDAFPHNHPPVRPVFFAFRIMVGIGILMLLLSWLGVWQLQRRHNPSPFLIRSLIAMTFAGWVATLSGWYVTEIGRQPYLVSGVLTTAQAAASPTPTQMTSTLLLYLAMYIFLLCAYILTVFYLARKA